MENKKVLGVDIGNVIIDFRQVDTDDKNLMEERYSTIPPTDNVFKALKKLNDHFGGDVFLVSKCTEWAEEKIGNWLNDNNFYSETGIKKDNVLFCRERREKKGLCEQKGVTHFIDDRLENLGYLVNDVEHLYLFQPKEDEIEEYKEHLPYVVRVENWEDVLDQILR